MDVWKLVAVARRHEEHRVEIEGKMAQRERPAGTREPVFVLAVPEPHPDIVRLAEARLIECHEHRQRRAHPRQHRQQLARTSPAHP